MTRLQESQFSCPADLNEILVWGINPMKHLLNLMDTHIEENLDEEDEEVMLFFRYEFEDKINGIEETINRFMNAMRKKAPDTETSHKDSSGA